MIAAGLTMRFLAVIDDGMLLSVAVSSAVTLWWARLRR